MLDAATLILFLPIQIAAFCPQKCLCRFTLSASSGLRGMHDALSRRLRRARLTGSGAQSHVRKHTCRLHEFQSVNRWCVWVSGQTGGSDEDTGSHSNWCVCACVEGGHVCALDCCAVPFTRHSLTHCEITNVCARHWLWCLSRSLCRTWWLNVRWCLRVCACEQA